MHAAGARAALSNTRSKAFAAPEFRWGGVVGRSTATPAGTARRGGPSLDVGSRAGVATPDPRTRPPLPIHDDIGTRHRRTRARSSTITTSLDAHPTRTLRPAATHDLEIDTLLTPASGHEAGVSCTRPGVTDACSVDGSERRIQRVDGASGQLPGSRRRGDARRSVAVRAGLLWKPGAMRARSGSDPVRVDDRQGVICRRAGARRRDLDASPVCPGVIRAIVLGATG